MSESKYYSLADKKRLFKFPFKLKEVGWLPGHYFSHKNAVLEDIYVCMSCYMEDGCLEKNGKIVFSEHDYDKIKKSYNCIVYIDSNYNYICYGSNKKFRNSSISKWLNYK